MSIYSSTRKRIGSLDVYSLFSYQDFKEFYVPFKFFHHCKYKLVFENLMNDYDVDILADDFIFLPVSNSFHVDYLVRLCANKFQMPFYYCFEYNRKVAKNCKLDRSGRFFNLYNSLYVDKDLPIFSHYFLFDDIVTTGSTLFEMKRALMDFGISDKKIYSLTFFKSYN